MQALSLATQELEETLPPAQIGETGEILEMLKRTGRLNVLVSRVSEEQVNLMSAGIHKLVKRLIDLSPISEKFHSRHTAAF